MPTRSLAALPWLRWPVLAALSVLASCGPDAGQLSWESADTADSAASWRPFTYAGRIAPGGPPVLLTPAESPSGWLFQGREGARLEARIAEGDGLLTILGPKRPGDRWQLDQRREPSSFGTTLPADGLYAVVVSELSAPGALSLACLSEPCAPPTWVQPLDSATMISLLAVGDLGLLTSGAPLDRAGGWKYAEYHYYHEMLEGFTHFTTADFNLVNLETAVTSGGVPQAKQFNFRMPVEALREVVSAGFNLFSLANNHLGDYGVRGVEDTLDHLEQLRLLEGAPIAWSGAGVGFAEAAKPALMTVEGFTLAHASCGIGYNVQAAGTGVAHLSAADQVIAKLAATAADLRVLSIHGGVELQLYPTAEIMRIARRAVDAGIQLVHGHHPHVAQGIERRAGGLILYSLGNFELRGARNMAERGADQDYGLAVRVGFDRLRRSIAKLEVVPLYDMHRVVVALDPLRAADRVRRLNHLSAALTGGVMLDIDPETGHGLAELAPAAGSETL